MKRSEKAKAGPKFRDQYLENILAGLLLLLAVNMLCMAATLPQQLDKFNRFMRFLTH